MKVIQLAAAVAAAGLYARSAYAEDVAYVIVEAPGPEMDMEMAGERGRLGGRVGFNFGTGSLYTQNRFGNRRRALLEAEAEAEGAAWEKLGEEMAHAGEKLGEEMAHAGEKLGEEMEGMWAPEAEMAGERGRLGGRVGFNFGTGTLYTQNRFDNRRRALLEAEAEGEAEAVAEVISAVEDAMAAPGPELELAQSRSSIFLDPATLSRPELRYGSYAGQITGKRHLLSEDEEDDEEDEDDDVEDEDYDAAEGPETELELAGERGRIGGRTGYNFGTGSLYTEGRYDDRRRALLDHHEEAEAEAEAESEAVAPGPDMELAGERGLMGGRVGFNFGSNSLYTTVGQDNRRRALLSDEEEHDDDDDDDDDEEDDDEDEMMAAEAGDMESLAPEAELGLASARSSIFLDPATLSRPELRYGSYAGQITGKRHLLQEAEEAESSEEIAIPPMASAFQEMMQGQMEMMNSVAATLGGPVQAFMETFVAPAFELAGTRSSIFLDPATLSRPELRYGAYAGQITGRRLLDDEAQAAAAHAAPGPELELATDRSSIFMDPATLSDPTLEYGTYLPELEGDAGKK